MIGRISSIETMSTLDGPGVRVVIFFQGCNMRCVYCHNPETWDLTGGYEISDEELFNKIIRYKSYFGEKGGVTFSGGEVLLQSDFLQCMLKKCKQNGIHTAIDTAGADLSENVVNALDFTELVLLDIKMTNEENYRDFTKGSLSKTLKFLKHCEDTKKKVWIRHVVVPNINDSEEDAKRVGEILHGFSCIEKIEFLPFEKLCIEKYDKLGLDFPLKNTPAMNREKTKKLQSIAEL